jgi:hypothetical protein
MSKIMILAGALVLSGVVAAHAQSIPVYDVTVTCKKPPPFMSKQDCIQAQYLSRWSLIDDWGRASPAVREECRSTAGRYGDYNILMMCIMAHTDNRSSSTLQPSPITPPIPSPSPSPSAAEHAADTPFAQGLADREAWETWSAGLKGDYWSGALYWSGQRSLPMPGSSAALGGDATAGCEAAKLRLDVSDGRRKTDPAYRLGWNSYINYSVPRTCEALVAEVTTAIGNALASGELLPMLESYGADISAHMLVVDDYEVSTSGGEAKINWSACRRADPAKVGLSLTPEERAQLAHFQALVRHDEREAPQQQMQQLPTQQPMQQTVDDARYLLHRYVEDLTKVDQ